MEEEVGIAAIPPSMPMGGVGTPMPPAMSPGVPMGMPGGGLGDVANSPVPLENLPSMMNEEQLMMVIEEIKMALMGTHPGGDEAGEVVIRAAVEMFGPDFVEEVSNTISVSDGMSDSLSGRLGNEEIAVSEGEYIVPAREVSSLGNGSTEAGGRALDRMVQEIRMETQGTPSQLPPIMPEEFSPTRR